MTARIAPGMDSPATLVIPVTPSDTVDLPDGIPRSLLVGTAGTMNMIDRNGVTRTGVPVQQGYNPICPRRITTGGTASNIWALY